MKRLAMAAAAAAFAIAAVPGAAAAQPQGAGLITETFDCAGGPVTIQVTRGGGVTGWVGTQHLKAVQFTFTDAASGQTFTKRFGQGPKGEATITCESSDEFGTFGFVAVEIPGSRGG